MSSQRPEIAVVILTINQKEKTLRCLESFRAVKEPTYRIFLWDNGSTDGTLEAVGAQYPEVVCAGSPQNLGVASGRNAASKLAISEIDPVFLFFIDNDMVVSPRFLSTLVAPFSQDPTLALTTGKIACLGEGEDNSKTERVIYGAGGCKVSFWLGDTSHIGYGELDKGQHDEPGECIVSGGCMLVRSSVFQELEGFDPIFDPYGPEDLDFGLRARERGYHGRYEPKALVWHDTRPGRSFEAGQYTERYAANRARTWLLFMKRHASLGEKLGFYIVGGPYRLILLILREGRKGSFNALKGLVHGLTRYRKV
jgi:GT2 family glycosyltransferase